MKIEIDSLVERRDGIFRVTDITIRRTEDGGWRTIVELSSTALVDEMDAGILQKGIDRGSYLVGEACQECGGAYLLPGWKCPKCEWEVDTE